jgi:hypothetical protein
MSQSLYHNPFMPTRHLNPRASGLIVFGGGGGGPAPVAPAPVAPVTPYNEPIQTVEEGSNPGKFEYTHTEIRGNQQRAVLVNNVTGQSQFGPYHAKGDMTPIRKSAADLLGTINTKFDVWFKADSGKAKDREALAAYKAAIGTAIANAPSEGTDELGKLQNQLNAVLTVPKPTSTYEPTAAESGAEGYQSFDAQIQKTYDDSVGGLQGKISTTQQTSATEISTGQRNLVKKAITDPASLTTEQDVAMVDPNATGTNINPLTGQLGTAPTATASTVGTGAPQIMGGGYQPPAPEASNEGMVYDSMGRPMQPTPVAPVSPLPAIPPGFDIDARRRGQENQEKMRQQFESARSRQYALDNKPRTGFGGSGRGAYTGGGAGTPMPEFSLTPQDFTSTPQAAPQQTSYIDPNAPSLEDFMRGNYEDGYMQPQDAYAGDRGPMREGENPTTFRQDRADVQKARAQEAYNAKYTISPPKPRISEEVLRDPEVSAGRREELEARSRAFQAMSPEEQKAEMERGRIEQERAFAALSPEERQMRLEQRRIQEMQMQQQGQSPRAEFEDIGLSRMPQSGNLALAADPNDITATKVGTATSQTDVKAALKDTEAAQGTVSDGAVATAATMEPTDTAVSDLTAAQGDAIVMNNPTTREIQAGELISGSADAEKAVAFTEQVQAATATPSAQATVKGQLTELMQDFEGGATPPWAAGAMRNVSAQMAARGLGASSIAGQALVQAAMESALPIAAADAQTVAGFEMANLSNRQQRQMLAAEQRAAFIGQEFDQNFQAKVQNATRISDIANMNFTAEQQVALENSRNANSVNMANLTNRQALIMGEAAAISNLEMANLSNQQQAALQNAQTFLQMDMANLNNRQQTEMFKSQSMIQSIFTDQAATNASLQFNASSENQTKQFMANMRTQVNQFNASQTNAMTEFNVSELNGMAKFNSDMRNQRDQFNATNQLVIAQSNAKWRQDVSTMNTTAQNVANAEAAKVSNAFTASTLDQIWQRERDMMSMAWKSSESSADRANAIIMAQMGVAAQKEALATQAKADKDSAMGGFFSSLLLYGITGKLGS